MKKKKSEKKKFLSSFENERNLNESFAVSATRSNPKFFYACAKNNTKVKTKIGPLMKNEVIISDPKTIAQMLHKQYDSVYSNHDENCLVDDPVTLFSTTNSESSGLKNIDYA